MDTLEDQVAAYTARKLHYLKSNSETGRGKADLATLRRGIGKKPGEIPQLWAFFLEDFPEELDKSRYVRESAENSIYLSLTLYAFHQQGKSINSENMHQKGEKYRNSVGTAARKLVKSDQDLDRILARLSMITHADSIDGISVHLRSLISLLRESGISLDYINLSRDLFRYQNPNKRDEVRLNWARDFYAFQAENQTEENQDI